MSSDVHRCQMYHHNFFFVGLICLSAVQWQCTHIHSINASSSWVISACGCRRFLLAKKKDIYSCLMFNSTVQCWFINFPLSILKQYFIVVVGFHFYSIKNWWQLKIYGWPTLNIQLLFKHDPKKKTRKIIGSFNGFQNWIYFQCKFN